MPEKEDDKPIALEAYESFAEKFAANVDTAPYNTYIERPATLSLLPPVKDKQVLDAGCGPGLYSEWLVKHGATVLALDISPKMVELARKRLGSKAEIRLADLSKPLDFLKDQTFDIVLSPLVLDYVRDWQSLFTEFARILRRTGYFIFSVEHPFTKMWTNEERVRPPTHYWTTERVEIEWTNFGVVVPSYRRPIEAMIDPLYETGFIVERILEPQPTEECRRLYPETYEKTTRKPSFMCIRARKQSPS